nr:hypothetical protein [Tanacetum cinerariifolium]
EEHTEQPEFNNEGEVNQYTKQCQVTSTLLNPSLDNKTAKSLNQSLKLIRLQHWMLVWLSPKAVGQNQTCKIKAAGEEHTEQPEFNNEGEVDQYTKQCQVTKNEHLHKENENLKQTYKDLYDSIKKTRVQTKDHNDSLIIQLNNKSTKNTNLKSQIWEKVFAIAALKNKLRKLNGNSIDTKFAKPSIFGKPVLQSLKNQSVVRQLNALKYERPKISKPRFASQVNAKNDLSNPVTQHYLPKGREYAFAKPHQVIASSESRNSFKNMSRFSSNDIVHNHYLEKAKKKTQERDRNSTSKVMYSTRLQNTTNGSKPKPERQSNTLEFAYI